MDRVLIIGNGYAGNRAAQLLAGRAGLEVVHVSDEAHPAYCRHLLPGLAAGNAAPADLHLPSGNGGAPSVRSGAAVVRMQAGSGKAGLADGSEVAYDRALIATGAHAFVPGPFREASGACGNVVAMRRMEDAVVLRRLLSAGGRRVAVVGAGRIGVLLAGALAGAGATVALVDIAPEILPLMLHADLAARLRRHLEADGRTSIFTGRAVERVVAEAGVARELLLSDGTPVPCDAVVLAAGVVPNVAFLDEGWGAGPGGIPVNERMETRVPGVYAAGDVVRFATMNGTTEPGQLVVNACLQAEAAARNIAGEDASCAPMFVGNVVKAGPLVAARAGAIDGTGQADLRIGESFLRISTDGDAMKGFQFLGFPEDLRGLVPGVLARVDAAWAREALRGTSGPGLAPRLLSGLPPWA